MVVDKVIHETGDDLSEVNLTQAIYAVASAGDIDLVSYGLGLTYNSSDPSVDIAEGAALITENKQGYPTTVAARTGVSLTDNQVNYIYVAIDTTASAGDAVSIVVDDDSNGTEDPPSDPHIKIGEIDTSSDTVTEINRSSSGGQKRTLLDEGTFTIQGGTTVGEFTVTPSGMTQTTKIRSYTCYADSDPGISTDYVWSFWWEYFYDNSADTIKVTWDPYWITDPGNGNDIDVRWELWV